MARPPLDDEDREEEERLKEMQRRIDQDEKEQRERDARIRNDPHRRALIAQTHRKEMSRSRNMSPLIHERVIEDWQTKRNAGIPPARGSPAFLGGMKNRLDRKLGRDVLKMPRRMRIPEEDEASAQATDPEEDAGPPSIPPLAEAITPDLVRPRRTQSERDYRQRAPDSDSGSMPPRSRSASLVEPVGTTGPRVRKPTQDELDREARKQRARTGHLASGFSFPNTGVIEPRSRSSSTSSLPANFSMPANYAMPSAIRTRSGSYATAPTPAYAQKKPAPSSSASFLLTPPPRPYRALLPPTAPVRRPVTSQPPPAGAPEVQYHGGARRRTTRSQRSADDGAFDREQDRGARSRTGSQPGSGQAGGSGGQVTRYHQHDPYCPWDCNIQ